jgi:hypothetical protein
MRLLGVRKPGEHLRMREFASISPEDENRLKYCEFHLPAF